MIPLTPPQIKSHMLEHRNSVKGGKDNQAHGMVAAHKTTTEVLTQYRRYIQVEEVHQRGS